MWFTLILFVATIVANEYLRPKPKIENQRPAGLGDFQFPTATEGRVVPLVWGEVELNGPNVVWYDDLEQEAIKESVKTGMWSKTSRIAGFRYNLGVQMALCRGSDVELVKVRIGDVDVFSGSVVGEDSFDIDLPELFGGDKFGSGGIQATVDFFPGNSPQSVSDYLNQSGHQKILTAATQTASAYNGTCYVVARELGAPASTAKGAYFGNSTTIRPWAFTVRRFPGIFSGQNAGDHKIGTKDCNPMNVIYEILTDRRWGLGNSSTKIDIGPGSSFVEASDTLIAEGNGFSMVLDKTMQAIDLLHELERQIDGFVFVNKRTGKWTVKLARDDYDIDTVPQITDDNSEVTSYTKGSWEDTTNQVVVQFNDRNDQFKETFALAQDMANQLLQGAGTVTTGRVVSSQVSYPGVKNGTLANTLAWRDLRTQAYPLSRVTLEANREFGALFVGSVIAWTSEAFGFTKLPLRVTNIDYGRLQANKITLTCVQDIFRYAAASYGDPPDTGWTPPVVDLVAYPSAQQLAMESPRALVVRDPEFGGDDAVAKILTSARRQSAEAAYVVTERHSSGSPAGSYADAGEVVGFMKIGKLLSTLAAGTAIPTSTITIVPDPDGQTAIETLFNDAATTADLGVDMIQLILVGTEFMLVKSAAVNAGNVDLQNVYRGVLDSAQQAHAANDAVYLVFAGSGLTDTIFPNTNNVDIELRARDAANNRFAGSVTTIALTMAKRAIRPYPVSAIFANGSSTPFNTPNLEGNGGAGENTYGVNFSWRRRRFNTTNEVDELLADQTVDASTEYQLKLYVDPTGANVLVHTSAWQTGTGPEFVNRLAIIGAAAAGTAVRVQVQTRHDIGTETDLTSRYTQDVTYTPTSVLSGKFFFGGNLGSGVPSNLYTAVATGTFTLQIGAAFSVSNVQVSINGGAYSTVIAATATSGTFAVTSGQTIRIKHTTGDSPSPNFVELINPSATRVCYGSLA